jgi:hypothetical protein
MDPLWAFLSLLKMPLIDILVQWAISVPHPQYYWYSYKQLDRFGPEIDSIVVRYASPGWQMEI